MSVTRPIVRIAGLGTAVPERVVTNAWFEERLDTNDAWIIERTGIRERRHAGPEESVTELARRASLVALERAGRAPADLDSIVLGTATPDRLLPATACDLQAVLGATEAAAFDVSAACPGFLFALTVAEGLIASGQSDTSLILGAEKLTCITDFEDRSTAILFGDGAGAAVLERVTNPTPASRGVLSTYIGSDGRLADLLYRPGGGATDPISDKVVAERSHFLKMQGREVFKAAVRAMAESCDEAIQRAGVTADQIDLLVPHQANIRIIEATAKHAAMPMDRVMVNVDRFGNTSSASIPIALDEAEQAGRIGPGSLVLLVAFGAGFTWASAVVRW